MTLCELITNPITRMVEQEGKNLDEIAQAICPKVKHGREKIIRVIKDFIGEAYLIEHAEVLGYDVGKAQLAKKRKTKSHKKIDATTDTVVESESVTPISSCRTVNTEHRETGQTKGQEQIIEHNAPSCCQERKKIVSEEETQDEVQEIAVERNVSDELDDTAPDKNEFNVLLMEIQRLIKRFGLMDVKRAIAETDTDL